MSALLRRYAGSNVQGWSWLESYNMRSEMKTLLGLHLLLVLYSLSSVVSKLAANVEFLSPEFLLLYLGVLVILAVYAAGWQQILKRLPLTTAFSNKAITVVWGIIWGAIFFSEPISLPKVIGAILIIIGIVLFSHASSNATASVSSEADVEEMVL